MADLLLQWDNEAATADIGLHAGDFLMTDDIESAIIISLFTDRRAPADVELPAGEDRRGWWADSFPDQAGDEMGSLLWLLDRQVQTADVLERTRIYARDALQWMLDDGVLTKLEISATYPAPGHRELQIICTDRAGRRRVLMYQLNPQSRPDPFAEPEGTPGEIRGTGGPAPIVAAGWAAAAAGPAGEIQGSPGTEPIEATSWAPGAAGKPGEIHGASGVAAIEANAWTAEPAGKPGEAKGTSGVPAIAADAWAPEPQATPGEAKGVSGVPAIEADIWAPDPQGLAGEVGCGVILNRDYLTADSTLLSADNDEITADAEF